MKQKDDILYQNYMFSIFNVSISNHILSSKFLTSKKIRRHANYGKNKKIECKTNVICTRSGDFTDRDCNGHIRIKIKGTCEFSDGRAIKIRLFFGRGTIRKIK